MIETFKKYSAFNGLATRSQYWGVMLITWAITMFVGSIALLIMASGPVGIAIGLTTLLALTVLNVWINLATMVRRCRDADINPWFVLTMLIPYVNFIAFIVFGCIPSKEGNNRGF